MKYLLPIVSVLVLGSLSSCSTTPSEKELNPLTLSGSELSSSGQLVSSLQVNPELILQQKTTYLLMLLQKNDYATFAEYIHPAKGMMLSYGADMDHADEPAKTLQRKEFVTHMNSGAVESWGITVGTGKPLLMTLKQFWTTKLYPESLSLGTKKSFDRVLYTSKSEDFLLTQLQKRFPGMHFIEYAIPVSREKEYPSSLRFIYEEYQGKWFIVGVMRDGKM